MAVIPPAQYDTVGQLRAAMRNGAIREYPGYIAAVKVGGVDVGDQWPRGVSRDIRYSVVLTDTDVGISQSALSNLVPRSRVAENLRVIGPRRGTKCSIVQIEIGNSTELHFYPECPEVDDLHDCDGNPILELV